jgi:hypothetical protein
MSESDHEHRRMNLHESHAGHAERGSQLGFVLQLRFILEAVIA